MITLKSITKKMGTRLLFEDVTVSFNEGCRYGLTGPNGAGKSTLLRIIMGIEESTSGSVQLPKKVGFLKQNIEDFAEEKVIDTVIMGNKRLWDTLAERDRLYEEEMTDEVGMRLAELEEIVGEEEGYTAESDAEMLLEGMGISKEMWHEKMHVIPTDIQFRVMLCQALFGDPPALILDEPTNHLDLESITWLENFLHNYNGTLIVVSHDRHFLNAVTTHIADIDYETIILYPGNYDEMVIAKTSVRESAEHANKAKEKKIAQLREFVAKFGAGTRASQVQSRMREIERLQPTDLKKSNIQRPYIRFYPPEKPSGQMVFRIDEIHKSYDGPEVISGFSFDIVRGDKIVIIGNNGRGKTTLLKMLAGVFEQDSGKIDVGHQVSIGYFPQNHADIIDKSSTMTIFDWLKSRRPGVYDQDIRSILGKMLFGGDDAFKQLGHLSGGETARLIMGGLMLCNYSVLILDEPNNHLDLEAVSALGWALQEYKGTVIFSSHDRDLINHGSKKIIAFEEDGITHFDGTFEEYFSSRAKNLS
ncbi:MAG: putative ABC transporter ATP-binding protein YbiT [Chlamydiae bacterium]|nr:putative ABC transporter ATP-binding protein YbiT [Chlamydiota bacterium]